jgi:DNA-binding transcriptional ArsR family regulator
MSATLLPQQTLRNASCALPVAQLGYAGGMATSMRVSTPEALRALAHPLRQKILYRLELDGHGRAADLAQALAEPANSISFHLRTLARAGLVVEAPELARDRRDRVWRNAADTYDVAPGTPGMEVLITGYVDWLRAAMTRRDAGTTEQPVKVRVTSLTLSAEEARGLADELGAVLDRWAEASLRGARADVETPREIYHLITAVGPSTLPDEPA